MVKNFKMVEFLENTKTDFIFCLWPSVFMDIHVMVFMAFGYLLAFLKRFSYGGVSFTFFGAALAAQWGILMTGIFNELIWGHPHIELSIKSWVLYNGLPNIEPICVNWSWIIE